VDAAMDEIKQTLAKLSAPGDQSSDLNPETATLIDQIRLAVRKRYREKRDHGFAPTVIEETLRALHLHKLLQFFWDRIKEKADAMFRTNEGKTGDDQYAGTYVLDKLACLLRNHPKLTIDLVGQSAGAIAICQLIAASAARYELHFRNIIFLAPACTTELFVTEIASKRERFKQFRMFALPDSLETQDSFAGIYPHSLLYFISGVLEAYSDFSIVGMERFLSNKPPYEDPELNDAHNFLLESGQNRLVLSGATNQGEGLNCTAKNHHDFSTDPATRTSVVDILKASNQTQGV
jgi:hypothetical protein